jgi:hypothetical protein
VVSFYLAIRRSSAKANAVSFSSARTTKRFPLPRCASATKKIGYTGLIHSQWPAIHTQPPALGVH